MNETKQVASIRTILDELTGLLRQDHIEDALFVLGTIPQAYAKRPAINVMQFKVLLRAGKTDAAADALHQADINGTPEIQILRLRLNLQLNTGDLDGSIRTAKRLRILRPENGSFFARVSFNFMDEINHMGKTDHVAAEKAARTALEIDPDLSLAHKMLYRAVIASNNPDRVQDVLLNAVASNTAYPEFPTLPITFHSLPSTVVKKVQKAMAARWPEHISPQFNSILKIDSSDSADIDMMKDAQNLALLGKVDGAQHIVQGYSNTPVESFSEPLRHEMSIISHIPGPEQHKRALIVDEKKEVTASVTTGTGVTVLIFTGLMDRAMIDIQVFDAFCAQAGYATIYLRDFSRSLFISGLESIDGGRAQTLTFLNKQIAALKTKRLIVVGASAGGFAAIRYGIELQADRVICFSSPTAIDKKNMANFGDTRGRILAHRLQKKFDLDELDLKALIANTNQSMPIDLYYGQDSDVDRLHAEYIGDQPNVTLNPISNFSEHACIHHLVATDRLHKILTS